MGLKSVVLVTILVVAAAISVPMAQAQLGGLLGGLGGLGGLLGGLGGGGQGGLVGGLGGLVGGIVGQVLGLVGIQGILYCTPNGNVGASGSATPVFPNASVQLRCGGTVVSTTTTNGLGAFSFILDPAVNTLLQNLLSGCSLVVSTPLATCNANLPSIGSLQSTLQLLGNSVLGGRLNVANIAPTGFRFDANIT